jgi:hypothetical protein
MYLGRSGKWSIHAGLCCQLEEGKELKMIEGLKLDFSAKELREHLKKKSDHHLSETSFTTSRLIR